MRSFLVLMILAIALSISATLLTLKLTGLDMAKQHHKKEIQTILQKFTTQTIPLSEINLNFLYPNQSLYQLLPMSAAINGNFDKAPFTKKESCEKFKNNDSKVSSSISNKEEILEMFLCRVTKVLPEDFFSNSPYVSSNGKSFAYRLYNSQHEEFQSTEWIRSHAQFFTIEELKEIPNEKLDVSYQLIKELDPKLVLDLLGKARYVITSQYFIAKDTTNSNLRIYSLDRLEDKFQDKNYMLKPLTVGAKCFYQISNLCLERTASFASEIVSYPFYFVIILSILILLVIFILTFKKIQSEALENEQKRLAFRILTHELRTPVTNLILLNNETRKLLEEKNLSNDSLETLQLKFENEIYRLKRLAEKSATYLNISEKNHKLKLNLISIEKPLEYIDDLLAEHFPDLVIEIKKPELNIPAIVLDPYWFQIILKNLIENARKYGKNPITIHFLIKSGQLGIAISDGGSFPYKTLEEAILKSSPSEKGLGIGLGIVKTIVESMQGRLELIHSPTTFVIWLKLDQKINREVNNDTKNLTH